MTNLIRGVLLAGQFRTQHELNTMSPDGQRNTLIVEVAGRSKETGLQAFNDETLAGMGAVLVFLRRARIRNDAELKGMTVDDMRNVLIVELAAQTGLSGSVLQGMSNLELVLLGLGKPLPGGLTLGSFLRGVLLAGQFRTQHELNRMSSDDQRNTLIVELAAHSNQTDLQALNDFELAGAGALMVFLRAARIRTDAELKTLSVDDQRNIAIVEIDAQLHLGSKLQGLSNMDLVLAALGVDPVFKTPLPPIRQPPGVSGDTAVFDAGPLTSDLPLGGSVHLVMRRNGDFTFSTHAHDSGFDNIDYVISAVLLTASGIAFTFQHAGHVEGTSAGLPFGTPDRNDDSTTTGENPMISREFDGIFEGAKLVASVDGRDKLVGGIAGMLGDLLSQAAAALGKAAVSAAVALVV
jgi:hypothetical protein